MSWKTANVTNRAGDGLAQAMPNSFMSPLGALHDGPSAVSVVVGSDGGTESLRAGVYDATGCCFRAAIAGICFGTRAILDRMAAAGFEGREIVVGGGATRSQPWLQIHADAAGLAVRAPDTADPDLLGSTILAEVGLGTFATIDKGIAAMTRFGRVMAARPEAQAAYAEVHPRYRALDPALKSFCPAA